MKKQGIAGLLLGVSMALLLAGGVALAQTGTVEPYCYWCCDACEEPWTCDGWILSFAGWEDYELLDLTLTSPGPWGTGECTGCVPADANGDVLFDIYFMCAECRPREAQVQVLVDYAIVYGDWKAGDYGEWTIKLEGAEGKVKAKFYFAEDPSDCEVEEQFVPEPGTLMLLGSGLAGLAGYAGLRWRARE